MREITFLEDTWIRTSIANDTLLDNDFNKHVLGFIRKGKTIKVKDGTHRSNIRITDRVNNFSITSDRWFTDQNGWYYWYGSTSEGYQEIISQFTSESNELNKWPDSFWNNFSYIENAEKINWALERLDIVNNFWTEGIRGNDIRIAILDDGIRGNNKNLNVVKESNYGFPQYNHGTKCANLIGGKGIAGVFGIAPESQILSYCISHDNNSIPNINRVNLALNEAIEDEVNIINMSFYISEKNQFLNSPQYNLMKTLISKAHAKGILCISSFGNTPYRRKYYPSCFEDCLSIGGYDTQGQPLKKMPKNDSLDFLSPGENLRVHLGDSDNSFFGETSASSAFTSGIMALIIQRSGLKSHKVMNLIRTTNNGDNSGYINLTIDYLKSKKLLQ